MSAPTPRLRHRLLQPSDFEEALGLLPPWLGLPDATRAALPALWAELLHQPGFNADVIEDVLQPPGRRLQALGVAVVLDDPWCRRLAEAPPAYAARHLYGEMLAGRFRPPSDAALARANAGEGVEFLVLHYWQRHAGLDDPLAHALWSVAMTAFRLAHAGHRVQGIHQEAWGDECEVMRSMGMFQRTRRTGTPGNAPLPELFGMRRAEALRMLPGAHLRDVFEHHRPVFGFSPAERRLLRRAVYDETDEEIARHLDTTVHTLKKQWRSVYARVSARMPAFFGDGALGEEGGRGPEKRRLLVSYLRQHPEELRPFAA
ncbi:hypothetical protein V4F39_24045 [Aquincola sp. MAHUQ-54]|uniref:Uncharacterized protein n=1 Tax=Aquincola agrisoli TaxID=3119538 RepID=A0AAW9QB22_9BURK